MLNLLRTGPVQRKCDGSTRREFLQIGTLALGGLSLVDLLRFRAAAVEAGLPTNNKSVILLFLDGGAPQHETFDPKMQAPKEYRSYFGDTQTAIPGLAFGSQFPQMAKRVKKMSVLRTLTHGDNDHGGATHWLKTGKPWPPEFLGKAAIIPQQSPSIGSVVARHRGPINERTGVPTYVRVLSNHGGYPGDDAVWLGQANSPFRVSATRTSNNTMLSNMALKVPPDQLEDRRGLLRAFDHMDRTIDTSGVVKGMDGFQQQAVNVVLGKAKEAFDLGREPEKIRDRYGSGLGQELLLARRLCEAGAGFVTLNNGYWDFHGGLVDGCKKLCPPLDHAVAAFMDDVEQRGLEKDILLVVTGEFGRTPRLNGGPGRDHWAPICSLVVAGGGLQMGQVIGESDEKGGYVKTRPISPADLMATIFHVLGMDIGLQYLHTSGRPIYMVEDGKPIEELL